ncbi:probable multidrug resistance protein [Cyanidioschyzon merolae strain 10D]|uniref:Probable multidrug resistance protein n=1 Tax=Cyanidioschyzon merolae (strain NIES-3377 / 10D) TaxID=280699 RepID=M1UWE1_CYAM1|nr:probable multidrug resistance protein [Cyanidioschyzon merolae strain 10D]BAM82521.1 probable multidrug resistance protein [Cyanidioschyzon merolae strain 10D]|eukprot:XP_005538557.1 probable multidrug resistance protein [Cyanidioschyzon merolae strain 10D]
MEQGTVTSLAFCSLGVAAAGRLQRRAPGCAACARGYWGSGCRQPVKSARNVRLSTQRRRLVCCANESERPLSVADKTEQLLSALKAVVDPDLGQDIVTLGFVKNIQFGGDEHYGTVSFDVELTTPACPIKERFREECTRLAESLPFVTRANVRLTAQTPSAAAPEAGGSRDPLSQVSNIVLVTSAKGGVAKSTTAVNLAFVLARLGARVGILDADIYGPSLPIMVNPEHNEKRIRLTPDGLMVPLTRAGVKLMSFGYINSDPAMLRGPMVSSLLTQLIQQTDWGSLDYLLVDLPPGTGDIQITLGQVLKATAAVVVTTPQRLAFADVVKGIQLLDKMAVPPIAVVESMAYFVAPDTGKRYDLFGKGHSARISREFGIRSTFQVPLWPEINAAGDTGTPVTLTLPETSEIFQCYRRIAENIVQECARVRFGAVPIPQARWDADHREIVVQLQDHMEERIQPAALRRACRCAACVDECTGKQLLDPNSVDDNIYPMQMMNVGNYALAVNWSDGHQSIMPWERFLAGYRSGSRGRRIAETAALDSITA